MTTTIKIILCLGGLSLLVSFSAPSQDLPFRAEGTSPRGGASSPSGQLITSPVRQFKIPGRKATQYHSEEWGAWIDSSWGPGQGATTQLQIFDSFWNMIDQQWAGFPNLNLNWDSLRTFYRPQIGSGLSRGRFYALMSRMWLALQDGMHSYISDSKVDATFGADNLSMWQYKRGFPLMNIGTGWWDLLGAPATALPDSTALVYSIAPGNPLGLEPGDLLLGYEGVPWKVLSRQLLAIGVPVNSLWSVTAACPEAGVQCLLSGVGANWGMFDTIDVVKYSTGDTLHLATAPLANLTQTIMASDQVHVPGVPMPHGAYNNGPAVSWGIVQGTNIGYVYVWDWATAQTDQLWYNATYDLVYNKKVGGLILDFRMNIGGTYEGKSGWGLLFNFDPAQSYFLIGTRTSTTNHLSFSYSKRPLDWFTPVNLFDRPIAVLVGPCCMSTGDWNALRASFHPMARLFGKPTNGMFAGGSFTEGNLPDGWYYHFSANLTYLNVPGGGSMIHRGVQPDEEVWLTRDGVAKGEDDVVKRALEWIATLTYAHDVKLARYYARPGTDSVTITAVLANPSHHAAVVSALLKDNLGAVLDSVSFYNDGYHGDGAAGDSVWGARVLAPLAEGTFTVTVGTSDVTQGTSRQLPNVSALTTAGPLLLDNVEFLDHREEGNCEVLPYVKNAGTTAPFMGATISLSCADSGVQNVTPALRSFSAIAAGASIQSDNAFIIYYDPAKAPDSFTLHFSIGLSGHACWDTTYILALTGIANAKSVPTSYALEQNYPNPFNPTTKIQFSIVNRQLTIVRVFDLLGRVVTTLVNEVKPAGTYTVSWDAGGMSSGVYFYQLQAGTFTETKRLLLLK